MAVKPIETGYTCLKVNIGENADTTENNIGIIKHKTQCTISSGKFSVGGSPINIVMKILDNTNRIASLIK